MIRPLLAAALLIAGAPGIHAEARQPDCAVTSTADAGPGSLRALVAEPACPVVWVGELPGPIVIKSPVVIDRTMVVSGVSSGEYVPGTVGRTVGRGNLPLDPVPQPATQIINIGTGDGLVVAAPRVELHWLAVRGTSTWGAADVAVAPWAHQFTSFGLVLGTDAAGGILAPPADHPTLSSTFYARNAYGVRNNLLVSGWTGGNAYGAVIYETVSGGHLFRSFIVGSDWAGVGPTTRDAVSLAYGTVGIVVREVLVEHSGSSSAIELHGVVRVVIDSVTLTDSGRAGVTAFDAHGVEVRDSVIDGVGASGVGVYPGSSVNVVRTDIDAGDLPSVEVMP